MKGCLKFGLYGFGILFVIGLVSTMCRSLGQALQGIPPGSPTPTVTIVPTSTNMPEKSLDPGQAAALAEPELPLSAKSSDGWVFTIERVETFDFVETARERIRSQNGTFAVLVGTLTNNTDKDDCIRERDFSLLSRSTAILVAKDLLDNIKAQLQGIDYPGSFSGQCLNYDEKQPSFLVFDAPLDVPLRLSVVDTATPIGSISHLKNSSIALASNPPTSTPTLRLDSLVLNETHDVNSEVVQASPLVLPSTSIPTVAPTPVPTPTLSPPDLPIRAKSSRGWVFTIDRVEAFDTIETQLERFRPENGTFAVLIGTLTNNTDKHACIHASEFEISAGTTTQPIATDLLPHVKAKLNGMDYPGSFSGQCLNYDEVLPSFLVFDVAPADFLWLKVVGTSTPIGPISRLVAQSMEVAANPQAGGAVSVSARTPAPSTTATGEIGAAPATSLAPSPNALGLATATSSPSELLQVADTAESPTPTGAPVPTLVPVVGTVNRDANLRAGPGTDYEIVGSASPNLQVVIVGANQQGDWYKLDGGQWIAAFLIDNVSVPVPTLPPTATPLPTDTSVPTPTPLPTPTQLPLAPNCRELAEIHRAATSAQWDAYSHDGIRGDWIIDWEGTVKDVGDWSLLLWGYPMNIELGGDCEIYYVIYDEREALTYGAGEHLVVTAQVDFVGEFFGSFTYHVDEETAQIRRR